MNDRYAKYQHLKFDRPHPRVLRITMTSPLKLNAMVPGLHQELAQVWADADSDSTVSSVLITGAGNTFSAGGDMNHELFVTRDYDARMKTMKEAKDLVYGMINCSKPIVSAIRGWAVGAGLACGLLADISIVSKSARIMDGHTKIGVAAGDHAAIIWPLLCGMAKSKYYLMMCEQLDGAEAERIGLVSVAVDDAELDEKALAAARKLADGAPAAIRWTKYSLNNWLRQAGPIFDASLAMEMIGFAGPEGQEGISAFLEKRSPVFNPSTNA